MYLSESLQLVYIVVGIPQDEVGASEGVAVGAMLGESVGEFVGDTVRLQV